MAMSTVAKDLGLQKLTCKRDRVAFDQHLTSSLVNDSFTAILDRSVICGLIPNNRLCIKWLMCHEQR